jgi:hypothetical protein
MPNKKPIKLLLTIALYLFLFLLFAFLLDALVFALIGFGIALLIILMFELPDWWKEMKRLPKPNNDDA